MLLALLAAVGVAIILLTIADTGRSYRSLPSDIPLHFGPDGTVTTYGPRPTAWLLVVMQVACAGVFAWVLRLFVQQGLPARDVVALAGFADFMLLLLWRAQKLVIGTALSGRSRADVGPFWWFFGATMFAAIGLVTIVSHR